jgi:hypothetical protein
MVAQGIRSLTLRTEFPSPLPRSPPNQDLRGTRMRLDSLNSRASTPPMTTPRQLQGRRHASNYPLAFMRGIHAEMGCCLASEGVGLWLVKCEKVVSTSRLVFASSSSLFHRKHQDHHHLQVGRYQSSLHRSSPPLSTSVPPSRDSTPQRRTLAP